MKTEIKYEWCIETIDKDGDIIDCNFSDKLLSLDITKKNTRLCLIMRKGNNIDGENERSYVYFENETPLFFDNGKKIPQKYINEFNKHF